MPLTGGLSANLTQERRVGKDVFDCPGPDAGFVLAEKLAQTVAVDEVDRRRAIAGGFVLGVGSE